MALEDALLDEARVLGRLEETKAETCGAGEVRVARHCQYRGDGGNRLPVLGQAECERGDRLGLDVDFLELRANRLQEDLPPDGIEPVEVAGGFARGEEGEGLGLGI